MKRIIFEIVGFLLLLGSLWLNYRQAFAPEPKIDREAIRAEILETGTVWSALKNDWKPNILHVRNPPGEWLAYQIIEEDLTGIPPMLRQSIETVVMTLLVERRYAERTPPDPLKYKKRAIHRWAGRWKAEHW